MVVDRRTDSAAWYEYADSDVSLVTQWDDGRHAGPGPGTLATSSSSQPTTLFTLLRELDAQAGMQVLDAGTGTGETAALLTHRCGARMVTTIDVDPTVAAQARERLYRHGLYADVAVGDALNGCSSDVPYDRVLFTFGVRSIPAAMLDRVRTGGIIVAPYGTHYDSRDAVLRLTVDGDCAASGRFVTGVEFMKARAQRTVWPDHADYVSEWPGPTGTVVQPDQLTDAGFCIGLAVSGVTHTLFREEDGSLAAWFYSLTDRSWAAVRWPTEYGPGIVYQHGPRLLWGAVEAAVQWWQEQGAPAVGRFGLTVTPQTATPWLDDPGHVLPGGQWR
ncbi:protein-L-isoaspartate O-methyltransferase [Streptomyces sp. NPDC090741]|uniref:protein-L-isoaspartate O-methyltransferase family protein n=1 Tax=Streptomyces sp. NPDC090741 TaxID=3365967 RepID=UPI0037FA7428